MRTRRKFFEWAGAALGGAWLAGTQADRRGFAAQAVDGLRPSTQQKRSPMVMTGSDVGSLFPFIQSQAIIVDFPLSFLRAEFKDLHTWKKRARDKLLELLHYAPRKCPPRPEVVEKIDQGDHVRVSIQELRLLPSAVIYTPPGFRALLGETCDEPISILMECCILMRLL